MILTLLDATVPVSVSIEGLAMTFSGFVLAGFWLDQKKQWKAQNDNWNATLKWQERIDVSMFGANGDTGLSGTVNDHETRIRKLEDRDHENRIRHLEETAP